MNRVYSEISGLDISDETIKISISAKSYYEKTIEITIEIYRNDYVAEMRIVFKLLKVSILNVSSTN